MGMLLAMTMMEQEKERNAIKSCETPEEADQNRKAEDSTETEQKAVKTAKKPVKRATGKRSSK